MDVIVLCEAVNMRQRKDAILDIGVSNRFDAAK